MHKLNLWDGGTTGNASDLQSSDQGLDSRPHIAAH